MNMKTSLSTFAAAVLATWFTFATIAATLLAFSAAGSPAEVARVPHPMMASVAPAAGAMDGTAARMHA